MAITKSLGFDSLSRYVVIDKDSLDDECVQFPEVFFQVCLKQQEADSAVNDFRLKRAEEEIKLQDQARQALSNEGVKVTNAAIDAWVKKRKAYKMADSAYQSAKTEAARWHALKEAMQSKSYKLRDLVDLYIAQYYSDPSSADGTTVRRRQAIRKASRSRD